MYTLSHGGAPYHVDTALSYYERIGEKVACHAARRMGQRRHVNSTTNFYSLSEIVTDSIVSSVVSAFNTSTPSTILAKKL